MSSPDPTAPRRTRRALLAGLAGMAALAAVLPLGACGFQPLYGRHGTGSPAVHERLAEIQVGIIPNREGQILRNELISRLNPGGRPTEPAYRLEVTLSEARETAGLTAIDTVTRANLLLTANFVLVDLAADQPVTRQRITAIAGYEVLSDEVATLTAEISARRRALVQLADDIRTRVALALIPDPAAASSSGTPQ